MYVAWILFVGFGIAAVARTSVPTRDGGVVALTTLLGVVGAMMAAFAGRALGVYRWGASEGVIAAVLGAVALLAGYCWLAARPRAV
jgi:uncharacterized membrane protein YeaQ/YmgE (transglycosylase-associated protein family)